MGTLYCGMGTCPRLPGYGHAHMVPGGQPTSPRRPPQVTPLEQQLRDEGLKVDEQHKLLAQLSSRAHAWTARSNDRSNALADLSKALHVSGRTCVS